MRLPAFLLVLAPALGARQQHGSEADAWRIELVPYLWAASLDGTITLGALPETDVDAGFEELLENLDFAAATFLTARKGSWSALIDVSYVSLEVEEQVGASTVEIDSDTWWAALAGGHRLDTGTAAELDVFAGARYYAVDNAGSSSGGVVASRTKNEAWLDPIVGVVLAYPTSPEFEFGLVADVGGFGVGSDLTWELLPSLAYRLNDSVSLRLGYRWMDVDFEDSDFEYDVRESGLMLGMGFLF